MIVASRIPSLTKRMLFATLMAHARHDGVVVDAPARRLVRELEGLGYVVRIEQRAA